MAENKWVVDASVVLKWFLDEDEQTKELQKLWDGFYSGELELHVPSLFFYEMGSVLSQKIFKDASMLMSHLRLMHFQEHFLTSTQSSLALDLVGSESKLSFYDASYHALALQMGIPFLTADQKYFKAAPKKENIVLLKDFKL
jgi:predicted nucleic acid-binding protein